MAQDGSVCGIALKALIVSGKSNECRRASATSNSFCAWGEQEVLNMTLPRPSPWASTPVAASVNSEAASTAMRFDFMAGASLKGAKSLRPPRGARHVKYSRLGRVAVQLQVVEHLHRHEQ